MAAPETSPFQAAAAEPFPPNSPPGEPSIGSRAASEGADGGTTARGQYPCDGERTGRPSLSIARSGSIRRPPLWRRSMSTAVSDTLSGLGFHRVADLCGASYVAQSQLKRRKTLGQGAFAVVEIAELSSSRNGSSDEKPFTVAVKRLKPDVLESEDDVVAFIHESRLLLALSHPSIIKYVGLGCQDESSPEAQWRTMFLVQEYADTGSVKKLIMSQMMSPTRKLYRLQDAVRWLIQMAEGLAFLHSANPMIIHRDLKAENVLLTTGHDGQLCAKLADFGLHKLVRLPGKRQSSFYDLRTLAEGADEAGLQASTSSPRANPGGSPDQASTSRSSLQQQPPSPNSQPEASTAVMRRLTSQPTYMMTGRTGAYIYMAPEVFQCKPSYDEKVDVFSFGVIMHELLHRSMVLARLMDTGDPAAAEEFAHNVANGHRLPISRDLPEAIRQLEQDCLHGRPDLRPSMREVVRRLQEVQASGELEALEHRHGPSGNGACCAVM